jgi:hypothetical protein
MRTPSSLLRASPTITRAFSKCAASNLAYAHSNVGATPVALEPLFRSAATAFLAFTTLGDDGAEAAHNGLAMALEDQGKFDDAAALFAEILDAVRRSLGSDAKETFIAIHNYAAALVGVDRRLAEMGPVPEPRPLRMAIELFRECLAGRKRIAAEDATGTGVLATMNFLAGALEDIGELDETEALYTTCADGLKRLFAGVANKPPFAKECAGGLRSIKRRRAAILKAAAAQL